MPTSRRQFLSRTVYAGAALRFEQNIYHPTLMDGYDYPIIDGEIRQENLDGPQFVVRPQIHRAEVRIRTQE